MKFSSINISLLIFLIFPHSIFCESNYFSKAMEGVQQLLTSKFALGVYSYALGHAGAHIVATILTPVEQKYLELTDAQDPLVRQARLNLIFQALEMEQKIVDFYKNEAIPALKQGLPDYEASQQSICQRIKENEQLSAEEKENKIKAIDANIKRMRHQVNVAHVVIYEKMAASVEKFARNLPASQSH